MRLVLQLYTFIALMMPYLGGHVETTLLEDYLRHLGLSELDSGLVTLCNSLYKRQGLDPSIIKLYTTEATDRYAYCIPPHKAPTNNWWIEKLAPSKNGIIVLSRTMRNSLQKISCSYTGSPHILDIFALLHEFGHIEQGNAKALLEDIESLTSFTIHENQKEESAADSFAMNYMSFTQLHKLSRYMLYRAKRNYYLSYLFSHFDNVSETYLSNQQRSELALIISEKKWKETNFRQREEAETYYKKNPHPARYIG